MKQRLSALLDSLADVPVLIVGDVMIDEYIIGDSHRLSPEAPEPVIEESSRTHVPGGAGNVAVNIRALGGAPRLFSVVGDDSDGAALRSALTRRGVGDGGLVVDAARPTSRKTRLIARGVQVLRVDNEMKGAIPGNMEQRLVSAVMEAETDVVIVSDYAKGVVTASLVSGLVKTGKRIIVDPKSDDFSKYAGAFMVTPNYAELCRAAGKDDIPTDRIGEYARSLMDRHRINNMLVTLGGRGMLLLESGGNTTHIHTRAREVYDVTGAGDTVMAAAALAVAAGAPLIDACNLANIAAGVVVGKHRTSTATPGEIMAYAFGMTATDKIVDRATIRDRARELHDEGKTIVFTNGCFDLLHIGHISYLNDARGLGDVLVVGLNSDESVRRLKGPERPIIPEHERSHVLAALESVDYVVLFDEDTPVNLIEALRPDILVKGADYTREEVVGGTEVESWGGRVELIAVVDGKSTSDIINRIRNSP